jgi:hypothetical protein
MRRSQAFFISMGVAVAGLLLAACGATHSTTSTSRAIAPPSPPAANAAAHASIAFLSPRAGAHVGSTVHVRIHRSEAGRVRFILDGRSQHLTGASTIVYRHLRPGEHRVRAELLVASGQGSAATAVVRFRVRSPHITAPAAPPPVTTTAPAPPPAVTTTATPTVTTQTAPPVQTQTTAAPPAPATGIPQNGGGDDDADNHGAPSDGDGNI